MRTLNFIVEGQLLKIDPECDFSGIVPGTENYLRLKFDLSPEWKDMFKVVAFYSRLGIEYEPQILDDNNTCLIPKEVISKKYFKIRVVGRKKDGIQFETNKIEIYQNGG